MTKLYDYWNFIFLVNPLCISDVELEFLNEVEAFGYSVIIIFHIQKWVDNSPPVWSIKRWTCETVWIVLFRPWNDTEPRNIHKPSIDLIASYIMSSYYGLQVLSLNLKRSRVSFSPYFFIQRSTFSREKSLISKDDAFYDKQKLMETCIYLWCDILKISCLASKVGRIREEVILILKNYLTELLNFWSM